MTTPREEQPGGMPDRVWVRADKWGVTDVTDGECHWNIEWLDTQHPDSAPHGKAEYLRLTPAIQRALAIAEAVDECISLGWYFQFRTNRTPSLKAWFVENGSIAAMADTLPEAVAALKSKLSSPASEREGKEG